MARGWVFTAKLMVFGRLLVDGPGTSVTAVKFACEQSEGLVWLSTVSKVPTYFHVHLPFLPSQLSDQAWKTRSQASITTCRMYSIWDGRASNKQINKYTLRLISISHPSWITDPWKMTDKTVARAQPSRYFVESDVLTHILLYTQVSLEILFPRLCSLPSFYQRERGAEMSKTVDDYVWTT